MTRKRSRVLFQNKNIKIVLPRKAPCLSLHSLASRLYVEGCLAPTSLIDPDDFLLEIVQHGISNGLELLDETIVIHKGRKRNHVTIRTEHDRIMLERSQHNDSTIEAAQVVSSTILADMNFEKKREDFASNIQLLRQVHEHLSGEPAPSADHRKNFHANAEQMHRRSNIHRKTRCWFVSLMA